jgi:hypothetical protein
VDIDTSLRYYCLEWCCELYGDQRTARESYRLLQHTVIRWLKSNGASATLALR